MYKYTVSKVFNEDPKIAGVMAGKTIPDVARGYIFARSYELYKLLEQKFPDPPDKMFRYKFEWEYTMFIEM